MVTHILHILTDLSWDRQSLILGVGRGGLGRRTERREEEECTVINSASMKAHVLIDLCMCDTHTHTHTHTHQLLLGAVSLVAVFHCTHSPSSGTHTVTSEHDRMRQ